MIGILDYGLGNVTALVNCYDRLGIPVLRVKDKSMLDRADRLILPGVGAFDKAMTLFNDSGLRDAVESQVIGLKKPIFGICVGMQMLASSSDEGQEKGLGWIPGKVEHLSKLGDQVPKVFPHMGWNDISPKPGFASDHLFKNLDHEKRYYFLHSYFFKAADSKYVLSEVSYGVSFACAVMNENIVGVQFHPEKSHQNGLALLKNFSEVNFA